MPDLGSRALVALRITVAMAFVAGVGAIAHLPVGAPSEHAALRIALRTPLAQIEVCHDRTDEELAGLPVHMRQRRACEVTAVDYRLRLEVDGHTVLDRPVVHHGVRRNRPLVADEVLRLAPGSHRIAVFFAPETGLELTGGALAPPIVRFDEVIDFEPGRIRLLSLADDGAAFQLGG